MAKKKRSNGNAQRQARAKKKVTELINKGVAFNPRTISEHGQSVARRNITGSARHNPGLINTVRRVGAQQGVDMRRSGAVSAPAGGRGPRSSFATQRSDVVKRVVWRGNKK